MNYFLGIDIGTSATKAICYDELGNALKALSISYPLYQLKHGYAEQDPDDWYNATKKLILTLTKDYPDIKGIGLSGQMHGLVLLDKNDEILRKSIIWCDNRAAKEKEEIEHVIGKERIKEITGNEAMAPFTLAKLLWVKNNEPDIFAKINKVLLPKDYVKYRLTGAFKTEFSDASGMQLLDIKNKCYAKDILSAFDIKEEWLPFLDESVNIVGYLNNDGFKNLDNIFVVGGASDQAACALGNGIIKANDLSIALGSSGVVFKPIYKKEINHVKNMQVFMHAIKDTYHIMGVTNGCGLSYSWYLDNLCKYEEKNAKDINENIYNYIEDILKHTKPGANGVIYLPYLNGERTPHNDTAATASFLGIRQSTTKNEMTRAVIEGICYSLRDCYKLLEKDKYNIFVSGGGAKSETWIDILAANLNQDILFNNVTEAGTLGVAILAMTAFGKYKSIEDAISHIVKTNKRVQANLSLATIYDRYYLLYQNGYKSLKQYYQLQKDLEELK